jgi:hypothetical protein
MNHLLFGIVVAQEKGLNRGLIKGKKEVKVS